MAEIGIHAIWLAQDDPSKNTVVKLSRKGKLILHKKISQLPRRGIILDPLCGKVLGPEDRELMDKGGKLVGLDCSWAQIEDSVRKVGVEAINNIRYFFNNELVKVNKFV